MLQFCSAVGLFGLFGLFVVDDVGVLSGRVREDKQGFGLGQSGV